jgi:outer membrane biosynthesis protein TonB
MVANRPDRLSRTMTVSFAIHIGVVLALFLLPRDWLLHRAPSEPLMTISLGSLGAKTGGMNPAGAQQVEQVAPPPKRPEPLRPIPPKPEPVIAVGKTTPKPEVTKPNETAAPIVTRPPVTSPQVTPGTARAYTGSQSATATGLSVGGGAGVAEATFDPSFCCPDYVQEFLDRISARWNKVQPETGVTTIKFTINRDGTFSKPEVEKTSGSVLLDLESKRAFDGLKLPPLPAAYKESSLTIHLKFPYVR